MISAERFSQERGSYWQQLLPRLEPFVRLLNLSAGRFSPPLSSAVAPTRRAFVAELGFELFRRSAQGLSEAESNDLDAAAVSVRMRIAALSSRALDEIPAASFPEREQSTTVARRLKAFVQQRRASSYVVDPPLRGCGIVDGATADLLITRTPFWLD